MLVSSNPCFSLIHLSCCVLDPFKLLVHSGLPDSVTSSKKNAFIQLHSHPLQWTPLLLAAGGAVRKSLTFSRSKRETGSVLERLGNLFPAEQLGSL